MDGFGINLVLTTGTVTSAAVASERLPKSVIHQYVPMDMKRAMSVVFSIIGNRMLQSLRSPNSGRPPFRNSPARNVPQILVNARMSDRSNRRWSRRPKLAKVIFGQLSQVIAQSDIDGERFSALGAPWVTVVGNLKIDVGVPQANSGAY